MFQKWRDLGFFPGEPIGQLLRGRVRHALYPIRPVNLEVWSSSLLEWVGFDRPEDGPDPALYSLGVEVEVVRVEPSE